MVPVTTNQNIFAGEAHQSSSPGKSPAHQPCQPQQTPHLAQVALAARQQLSPWMIQCFEGTNID